MTWTGFLYSQAAVACDVFTVDLVRRARVGADVAVSYREHPLTPEDDDLAMANAIVMTEAESVLITRLGQLGVDGRQRICSALDAMANC